MTDTFLMEGIKAQARLLTGLALADVPLLTDEGVVEFFDPWTMKGEVTSYLQILR